MPGLTHRQAAREHARKRAARRLGIIDHELIEDAQRRIRRARRIKDRSVGGRRVFAASARMSIGVAFIGRYTHASSEIWAVLIEQQWVRAVYRTDLRVIITFLPLDK